MNTPDIETPYELLDQTLDLLAGDPHEARRQATPPLRQWQDTVRSLGLTTLAYDLEQLELAIEHASADGIRDGLKRAAKQTREAAQTSEGVLRSKVEELANALAALAAAFEEE